MEFRKNKLAWSAFTIILVVVIGFVFLEKTSKNQQSKDLGTYENPEQAFIETQKVLALLSNQINFGIENVLYIREYDNSKNLIFKK